MRNGSVVVRLTTNPRDGNLKTRSVKLAMDLQMLGTNVEKMLSAFLS